MYVRYKRRYSSFTIQTCLYYFRHPLIRMRMLVDVPSVQDDAIRYDNTFLVQSIQRQAIRPESFLRNLAAQRW